MKYAIVRINGSQYKVTPDEEFLVDYLGDKKPEPEVLFVRNDKSASVGTPVVDKAKVVVDVVTPMEQGEKLHVRKYKAKSRYHKKVGFRPKFTRLVVKSVNY